jgi:hypothetical protein
MGSMKRQLSNVTAAMATIGCSIANPAKTTNNFWFWMRPIRGYVAPVDAPNQEKWGELDASNQK